MSAHTQKLPALNVGSVIGNLLSRVGLSFAYPFRAHFINSDFELFGRAMKLSDVRKPVQRRK